MIGSEVRDASNLYFTATTTTNKRSRDDVGDFDLIILRIIQDQNEMILDRRVNILTSVILTRVIIF